MNFREMVVKEMERAEELYPALTTEHEALGVIREEYCEFEREVFKKPFARSLDRMLSELVQIAAMAERTAVDLGLVDPVERTKASARGGPARGGEASATGGPATERTEWDQLKRGCENCGNWKLNSARDYRTCTKCGPGGKFEGWRPLEPETGKMDELSTPPAQLAYETAVEMLKAGTPLSVVAYHLDLSVKLAQRIAEEQGLVVRR